MNKTSWIESTSARITSLPAKGLVAGLVGLSAVFGWGLAQASEGAPTPGPASFVIVEPYRAYDSRSGSPPGSPLLAGAQNEFQADMDLANPAEPRMLPAGTVAVAFNVTVTDTRGAGFVTVAPYPLDQINTSNVNWSMDGTTIANGGVVEVRIGDGGHLGAAIFVGGASNAQAHVVIDIQGYYVTT